MIKYSWAVVDTEKREIVRFFPLGGNVGTPLITQFKWEARLAIKKMVAEKPWLDLRVVKVDDLFGKGEARQ